MTNRYANGHRRRQLRARILATETVCALCGELVDKTIPTPHPLSPEIDEIIPVSRGGSPLLRSNTQLAHRACNQRKGARIISELLPVPLPPEVPTSRSW